EVQVRAAGRRHGDPQDAVTRIDDLGIVDGLDTQIVDAVPDERTHEKPPRQRGSGRAAGWRSVVGISPVWTRALKEYSDLLASAAGTALPSVWGAIRPSMPPGGSRLARRTTTVPRLPAAGRK